MKLNREHKTGRRSSFQGQGFLEFTFAIIVLLIMIYGIIRVFSWTGTDLAEGRIAHEQRLLNNTMTSMEQIDPYFFTPTPFNAIWNKFSL